MPEAAPAPTNDDLRRTLDMSNDPRVTRTRDAIIEAVRELVGADVSPISVSAIVRAADVSRSAFYAHFASLDDLALFILRRAFARIATSDHELRQSRSMPPFDAMRLSQERLVEHYAEHRSLYAAVLSLPVSRHVQERSAQAMAQEVLRGMRALHRVPAGISLEIAASYVANAAVGVLDAWLLGEIEATPQQVVDHLLALMPVWLSNPEQPDSPK